MNIQKNFNLKKINTFKIDVTTKYYVKCINDQDIINAINFSKKYCLSILPLGKGSNILFTKNFKGIVLHILTSGIKIIKETEDFVFLQVKSGECWSDFVIFCLENGYGGVENLSLIPGSIGASSIQNIGAYGVEIKDVIVSLNAIKIELIDKIKYVNFKQHQCNFDYRNSYFQQEGKNKWIVTDVIFRLTKRNHKTCFFYKDLKKKLEKNNILYPTIYNISDAVINIRTSKLPDLNKFGNAGSFFKNPIIDLEKYNLLKKKYYDLNGFKVYNGIRVPAGYFIEKIGFKGLRIGNYGVYANQSLFLINYSNAKGSDIFNFAQRIKKQVLEKFNITLLTEVNLV